MTNTERTGDQLTAQGELTLRGVTKPVALEGEIGGPAKDPWGNTKVSATLSGKISRSLVARLTPLARPDATLRWAQ